MTEKKHIILIPDWKSYFWRFLTGILLIPLLGIGFILLWLTYKKCVSVSYEIHDDRIREIKKGETLEIELLNIEDINVKQKKIENLFGVGSVIISAAVTRIELVGMENPHNLANMILDAKQAKEQRLRERNKRKPREPEHDPGTLDKMDYLTGLWQQGLINDEDYQKEKKHFE